MDRIESLLAIDPPTACQQIVAFLQRKLRDLGKDGLIIGLSGGFDSALTAYLSVRAVGAENVRLVNLPERDSRPIHRMHAELVAEKLSIPLEVIEITPFLEQMGIYDLLPIGSLPGRKIRELIARFGRSVMRFSSKRTALEERFHTRTDSLASKAVAYAMAKHRLRMLLLYQKAEIFNLMVVGAANRTELETGTFSQWGCDQCADVMPIVHLYRTQLYPLAEYVDLPQEIMNKAADPDFLPGLHDKGALLGSFDKVDRVLCGLHVGADRNDLATIYGEELVERIENLVELSKPLRESPYTIQMDDPRPRRAGL